MIMIICHRTRNASNNSTRYRISDWAGYRDYLKQKGEEPPLHDGIAISDDTVELLLPKLDAAQRRTQVEDHVRDLFKVDAADWLVV